jgi:DNA end-binding protein Ku
MAGRAVSAAPVTADAAPVVDLMSALRASVDAAKAARTSPTKHTAVQSRTAAAARKSPSKAVAAAKPRKVAVKKAPAKHAPRKTA